MRLRPLLLASVALGLLGAPVGHAAEGWVFSARLSAGGAWDEMAMGFAPAATPAYDSGIDLLEPPAPPGTEWVRAYVVAPADRQDLSQLARSFISPGAGAWTIRAHAGSEMNATLAWELPPELSDLLVVELGVGDVVHDLRVHANVSLALSEAMTEAVLSVYELTGEPPGPPLRVRALPGNVSTATEVRWDPPRDDGGLPVRGYDVWRVTLEGETWLARTGRNTTFVDHEPPLGVAAYRVSAHNAMGSGPTSALSLGAGVGRGGLLQPPPGDGPPVVGVDSAVAHATIPEVEGARNATDPRTYDLNVRAGGQEAAFTVFTDDRVPDVHSGELLQLDKRLPSWWLRLDRPPGALHLDTGVAGVYRLDEAAGP